MTFLNTIKSLINGSSDNSNKSVLKSVVAAYSSNRYYAIKDDKNIVALGYDLPADCEDEEIDVTQDSYALIICGTDYGDLSVKSFPAGTAKTAVTAAALDLVENGRNNVASVEVCKLHGKKFAGRSVYRAETQYYYITKGVDLETDVPIDDPVHRKALDVVVGDGEEVNVSRIFNVLKNTGTLRKGIVYGIVYAPSDIDTHGDYTSAEEIENAAHEFLPEALKNGTNGWTDINHEDAVKSAEHDDAAVVIVESYIAPCDFEVGDEKVKKGSWVLVSKIRDAELIKAIENGEVTGYSLEGTAYKV